MFIRKTKKLKGEGRGVSTIIQHWGFQVRVSNVEEGHSLRVCRRRFPGAEFKKAQEPEWCFVV